MSATLIGPTMAEARAKPAATVLLSLAMLTGACAGVEEPTGTVSDPESPAGEPSPRSTESTPPPAESPSPPTTDQREFDAPAPDPATDTSNEQPTMTEAAPAPPPDPAKTNPMPEQPTPAVSTDHEEAAPATIEAAATPEPPLASGTPEPPPPTGETAESSPPTTEVPGETPPAGDVVDPAAAGALPGEPYEWGPDEGTSLAVVGVPYEEVLELHDVPAGETVATLDASNPYEGLVIVREAPSGEFLSSLHSWTDAIVSTGSTRRLPDAEWPDAVWNEVSVAGLTGWASAANLAPIGLTDDRTAHLIDLLDARPEADTLAELALTIGEALASAEPPSRVVIVTRPIVFEALGEVTVDVLNLPDDSLLGYRLHVFATPAADDWMSENPGPFTLRTLERTILCQSHRGVTTDGLCV